MSSDAQTVKATLRRVARSALDWRRWFAVHLLAAALVPITLIQPYPNYPPIRSDGVGYHVWTHVPIQGSLNFAWYAASESDLRDAGLYLSDPARNYYANKYPPGIALIRLPFMLPFAAWGSPDTISRGEHYMALVVSGVMLLAVVGLMLDCCRRVGVSNGVSQFAVLALVFGTGLFHHATYDAGFSHVYSAAGVALLVWIAVRSAIAGRRLPFWATLVTILLLILVRNTNVFFVLMWALMHLANSLWTRTPRRADLIMEAMAVGGGVALATLVQVALNSLAHGRLTLSSYSNEAFLWDRPMMLSVLVSYERGLFVYYPLLAFVPLLGLVTRRARWGAVSLLLILTFYAALYGYWHSWMLGAGFGHRGFVEFVPAAMPVLAVALQALPRVLRVVAGAVVVILTAATVVLMIGYWSEFLPNNTITPERYWRTLRLGF